MTGPTGSTRLEKAIAVIERTKGRVASVGIFDRARRASGGCERRERQRHEPKKRGREEGRHAKMCGQDAVHGSSTARAQADAMASFSALAWVTTFSANSRGISS